MARNKYPEETVSKILAAALNLFLEKGYEHTTIQDIVNRLDGLTKGAIYHHFKSKEDILTAIGKQLFHADNPFKKVRNDPNLNGLEKFKKIMLYSTQSSDLRSVNTASLPLAKNPRLLAVMIENNRELTAPLFREIIEEGIRDKSIQCEYSKPLSEAFMLLTNLWMVPMLFPATKEEFIEKVHFVKLVFDSIGLPVFDDEIMAAYQTHCNNIYDDLNRSGVSDSGA